MTKEYNVKKYIIVFSLAALFIVSALLGYHFLHRFEKAVNYRFTSLFPGAQKSTTFSPGKSSSLKIPDQTITTTKSKMQVELLSPDIESIKATLKFKPNVNEVLLGVRGNEKDNFYYRPLYRDTIYQSKWSKLEENGITFLQKEQKYNSISDFVNNPPLGKTTAFYFLDKSRLPKPNSPQASKITRIINTPLRGSHSLLVKADSSPFVVKIDKQDLNGYDGEDNLKIAVLDTEKNQLAEKIIGDDGVTDASHLKTQPQQETITLNDIPPGLYQINLSYEGKGEDVLINKIEVNQAKVIFNKHVLFLGDDPITLWTNSKKVNIVTAHKQNLQTIKLNDKYNLEIKEEGKLYEFNLESITNKNGVTGLYKLKPPKNDINILGDGYFSFNLDSFFLPEMFGGVENNNLDTLNNIDYLLTSYKIPKKEGDWLVAEADFNPKEFKVDGNKLYFSLEIPQITKAGGELKIDSFEITIKHPGAPETKVSPPISQSPTQIKTDTKRNIIERVGNFEYDILIKIVNKIKFLISKFSPNKITPTSKPELIPHATIAPTPIPALSSSVKVVVKNGGAPAGTAGRFAEVLQKAGFNRVNVDNTESQTHKNASLKYRLAEKTIADRIYSLLQPDYATIQRQETASSSAEIIIILGKK